MSYLAVDVVQKFWELMSTNHFQSVGSVLADNFVLDYPQSNERIRGRDTFAALNAEYPAHSRWEFTINRIVGNEFEAVSDVSVTDGLQRARVISFFTTRLGQIVKMVEYWPEPFPAPENRRHLVERTDL